MRNVALDHFPVIAERIESGEVGERCEVKKIENAVVVFIENGGSSAYSVPIAREIMEYYFGFKNSNNSRDNIYYYKEESFNQIN